MLRRMPPRFPRRSRRPSPAVFVIGVRLSEEEKAALDRAVRELRQASPEAGHASRSSVLRALVLRHLLRRRSKRRPAPSSGAPMVAA